MATGIEIYNADNKLQITDKFKNLQFITKATLKIEYEDHYADTVIYNVKCDFALPAEYDITKFHYAFRGPENIQFAILGKVYVYGNTLTTILVSKQKNILVTVYVFGHDYISPGRYFEVYNDKQEVVFSDAVPFMKVIDSRSGTYDGSSDNVLLESITSSKTMAILPGNLCFKTKAQSGSSTAVVLTSMAFQGFLFKDNTIESRNYIYYGYANDPYKVWTSETNYNFLVLDVTGL